MTSVLRTPTVGTLEAVLRKTQSFDEHGRVTNTDALGIPGALSRQQKQVTVSFVQFLNRCFRGVKQDFNIPRSLIYDVLQNRLCTFPYKLQDVHQHEASSYMARIESAQWSLQKIDGEAASPNLFICFFECIFCVEEKIKRLNVRFWGAETPHKTEKIVTDDKIIN